MLDLEVTYSTWKQVAQNNGWTTYYQDGGGTRAFIWTGDRDHIYRSKADGTDHTDWQTNFEPTATEVQSADDAIALIVGLSGIRPQQFSADGTPQVSKQHLELGREPFQRTDNGSEQMNVDGVAAGTPVVLWNGTGAGDSGGDWTRTGVGTETTESAKNGTNGLDTGALVVGNRCNFDNGSEIDVDGTYDSLEFWVQPKAYPTGSRTRIFWEKSDGTDIGSKLRLDRYTSNMDLDVWQQVSIPIEDFGLTEDVAKLIIRCNNVDGQHLWYDDIRVVASVGGGPYKFRVSAPTGLIYHVERVALVVSAPDSGWDDTSFANITGGLGRGLLLRYRMLGGEIYWKVNCKNNSELFGQLQVINDTSFASGDRQFVFALEPQLSSVVLVDDDEVIDIVVRDDLSSISNMRAFLHFGTEELPT